MEYQRYIKSQIVKRLYQKKVIVIYGARQVGKTTLVKDILRTAVDNTGLYLSGDNPEVVDNLSGKSARELKNYLGDRKLVVIDEAQRIENIGVTLKLLVDNYPDMQVIATGSSSFDLANKISEPLTGRAWVFHMQPLALSEITTDPTETSETMRRMLRYGSFPGIWTLNNADAELALDELSSNFLFKDLLEFEQLKKAPLLTSLLQALALQLGHEVKIQELASLLQVDGKTIERYIFLLEQVFVIFRLPMLKRNPRGEVGKLRKIYFCDLGLRNSLIKNFNELDLRTDHGALWENFCINELRKRNDRQQRRANYYFWRSYNQQEVDFVQEYGGQLHTYELKWKKQGARLPKTFKELYPDSSFSEITSENFNKALL
jgi:predicted AAA+ superfamily ATPase